MYYLGDFTLGFITAQFPSLQAGTDFNFFPFPTINPTYAGAVTGGADMIFAMKDNNGTRQFMQFMSTAEAQTIWIKQGGASSVNKSVDLSRLSQPCAAQCGQTVGRCYLFQDQVRMT